MSFVAIILSWVAVQYWGSGGPIQRDGFWFGLYRGLGFIPWSAIRLGLVLLPPLFVLAALLMALEGLYLGLPVFFLSLLLLLYSLGRGDLSTAIDDYLKEWEQGDVQGAYHRACRLSADFQEEVIDDAKGLHDQVMRVLFYRGLERWFVPVFWFAVLSEWPWAVVVAVGYRVLHLLSHSPKVLAKDRQQCGELLHVMEWLPSRLLGLSFALVGRFETAFKQWRQSLTVRDANEEYLNLVGNAALDNQNNEQWVDGPVFWARCREQILSAQQLLARSLVVWVLVFSLVEIL